MTTPTMETQHTCRRVDDNGEICGKALDTTGYPLWCKACRSKHRNGYNATVKEMSETRGFATGITAMREHIAVELAKRGPGMYSAVELLRWVRTCKGPELPA